MQDHWPLVVDTATLAVLIFTVRKRFGRNERSGCINAGFLLLSVISALLAALGVYSYFFTHADTRGLPYAIYSLVFAACVATYYVTGSKHASEQT
ncbi:MAG: hypothetical protein QM739_01070 [Propionivibrio sp.]